jgi:hypothetical protein
MMLLERDLIQSVGFRNVHENGRATGFQFRVRMPSYRGMAASLIDGIAVRVGNLVDVPADVPLWTFSGTTYSLQELWNSDGVRWPLEDAAIVTVPFDGGLPQGVHEIAIELRLRMSYIPLEHQPSVYRVSRAIALAPEGQGGPFQYGVSLYSYMGDFGTVLDLETALAAVAETGATGVEILGEGHVPNYPDPSAAWIDQWYALLEKYSLEPTNYGSWIDTRLHPGLAMTASEGAAALQRDLKLAGTLGFKYVRPKIGVTSSDLIPDPIWTESVERSLNLGPGPRTSDSSSIPASSRTGPSRCARGRPAKPVRLSWTALAWTRPTWLASPSMWSSSRPSSTTSTTSSKTSRSLGGPSSNR